MASEPLSPLSQTGALLERFRLDGKVCLVTGAARGIGRAIAAGLSEVGGTVVLADLDTEGAHRSSAAMGAQAVPIDVTDPQSVERAFDTVLERHGRLDVLINNAGVVRNTAALETDDALWRAVMAVNLDGTFHCCRQAARPMLAQGGGSIVNVASMSASIVNRPQPQAAYNASKAGVVQLTRSLAAEWAHGQIRVNSVSPGYVSTPLTRAGLANDVWRRAWLEGTPLGRLATPEEIVPGVIFLASDASAFMTGADLVIDGGYTIW